MSEVENKSKLTGLDFGTVSLFFLAPTGGGFFPTGGALEGRDLLPGGGAPVGGRGLGAVGGALLGGTPLLAVGGGMGGWREDNTLRE